MDQKNKQDSKSSQAFHRSFVVPPPARQLKFLRQPVQSEPLTDEDVRSRIRRVFWPLRDNLSCMPPVIGLPLFRSILDFNQADLKNWVSLVKTFFCCALDRRGRI